MKGRTLRYCVDCNRPFKGWGEQQIRCPECQRIHRRKIARERKRRKGNIKIPKGTESKVINGHVQVCRCLNTCYYGQEKKDCCAYALEEKKTRTGQGLFIVDGKCPAYRPKTKNERLKRSEPKYCFERGDDTREIYRELTEV